MNPLILIIDDDEKLNQLVSEYLDRFGFEVISAIHPQTGMDILAERSPDLIILDVMLPGMDGFETVKKIRRDYTVPVIMLTARGEVTDRVVGLELGADDYLAKPFEPRELVARIQSILRRSGSGVDPDTEKTYGPLTVYFEKRSAFLDGEKIDLTTNEFSALTLLVKNAGKVLDRDQILEELRGMECEAFNRSVDITISRLRQKLNDDPKRPRLIKTVWGAGYVFVGEGDDASL